MVRPETHDASIPLSAATLVKNMVGAGILSLPVGLVHATPAPGLGIMAFTGALSAFSYWMIGYCCIAWKVHSFQELWCKVFGAGSSWIINLTITVNGWITETSYVILIGDFLTKSFEGLLGHDHFLTRNRMKDVWFITLFVLLPLSLQRDLSKLQNTTILGLGVMVYMFLLVLGDSWHSSPETWDEHLMQSQLRMGMFQTIALSTHAFVAHYNAPKVFAELTRPTPTRWLILVVVAYSLGAVLYMTFAYAGLQRFQGAVKGNILKNFEPRFSVYMAWLGMGFSIAFTYPIVFNSLREAALNLAKSVRNSVYGQAVVATPQVQNARAWYTGLQERLFGMLGMSAPKMRGATRVTILVVVLSAIVGTATEDVGIANALGGSVTGMLICFILPSLLFIKTVRCQLQQLDGKLGEQRKPLLSHAANAGPAAANAASTGMLRFGVIAGAFTAVCGVIFLVIGTVVILVPDGASFKDRYTAMQGKEAA